MRTPCEDDGLDGGPRARTRSLLNSTEADSAPFAKPSYPGTTLSANGSRDPGREWLTTQDAILAVQLVSGVIPRPAGPWATAAGAAYHP
jgi:hypothetical protein